jgi:MoxR-like ATPase
MTETTEPISGQEARERLAAVRTEVAKAVVGQDAAVSGLLVALLCGGHVLMEGVPGVAKTLLVRTLAGALSVDTRRVQFTPDLMPGDITGSMVIDSRQGELSFREGPIFTNLLLADEINRTPPKTQSALLEAMEEGQVSVDGVSRPLPRPFLVAATQSWRSCGGTPPASTRATSRAPAYDRWRVPTTSPPDGRPSGRCRSAPRWPATSWTSPARPASHRR